MTRAETIFYISVGQKKLKSELDLRDIHHAELLVSILNAPHSRKRGGGLYNLKDMLRNRPKKQISEAEKSKRWAAAGNAMMEVVEQHKQSTIVKCRR